MSHHTRTSLLVHCVFSTKNRSLSIPAELKSRLWAYVGGIARTNDMTALAVGGMSDHIHILLSLVPVMPVAKAIQLIKAGSSKWMREQSAARFEWQVGYGAFTVGVSQVPATVRYILNQEKHHAKKNFAQEWKMFLERHGLETA
jgi:putative transposase